MKSGRLIREYIYRFNGFPKYEALLSLDGFLYQVEVWAGGDLEKSFSKIEIWNSSSFCWLQIHMIPGAFLHSKTLGLSDSELTPQIFEDDLNELVVVAQLIVGAKNELR